MKQHEIVVRYFNWLYDLVTIKSDALISGYDRRLSYGALMNKLFETDFTYLIDLDGNRASDGIELRYRFGHEQGIRDAVICHYLDDRECSILEMLVGLCLRCEEHIMSNPDKGNRVGVWFWNIMDNLGLTDMSDTLYDEEYVDDILFKFINREYGPHGEGGPFYVYHPRSDMRSTELWYQLNWYLDELGIE